MDEAASISLCNRNSIDSVEVNTRYYNYETPST